jgi:hypothetical protein
MLQMLASAWHLCVWPMQNGDQHLSFSMLLGLCVLPMIRCCMCMHTWTVAYAWLQAICVSDMCLMVCKGSLGLYPHPNAHTPSPSRVEKRGSDVSFFISCLGVRVRYCPWCDCPRCEVPAYGVTQQLHQMLQMLASAWPVGVCKCKTVINVSLSVCLSLRVHCPCLRVQLHEGIRFATAASVMQQLLQLLPCTCMNHMCLACALAAYASSCISLSGGLR